MLISKLLEICNKMTTLTISSFLEEPKLQLQIFNYIIIEDF